MAWVTQDSTAPTNTGYGGEGRKGNMVGTTSIFPACYSSSFPLLSAPKEQPFSHFNLWMWMSLTPSLDLQQDTSLRCGQLEYLNPIARVTST